MWADNTHSPGIAPRYLASQIRQAGIDQGLSRDYRSSLKIMAELEIELPIDQGCLFDFNLMKSGADFREVLDQAQYEVEKPMEE